MKSTDTENSLRSVQIAQMNRPAGIEVDLLVGARAEPHQPALFAQLPRRGALTQETCSLFRHICSVVKWRAECEQMHATLPPFPRVLVA